MLSRDEFSTDEQLRDDIEQVHYLKDWAEKKESRKIEKKRKRDNLRAAVRQSIRN